MNTCPCESTSTPGTSPSCTSPQNPIEAENCRLGNPFSEWYIVGAGSSNIQGFATDISVNAGQPVFFKISTDAIVYRIDIYRLGYYQGDGARLVAGDWTGDIRMWDVADG